MHSSIDKAVSILGIGTRWLRHVAGDDQFRIRLDLLAKAVAEDRANGASPFCVVASAGTVTTGAIDPLRELAAFCRAEGLWLHVDGAYGALAALSERFRPALLGRGGSGLGVARPAQVPVHVVRGGLRPRQGPRDPAPRLQLSAELPDHVPGPRLRRLRGLRSAAVAGMEGAQGLVVAAALWPAGLRLRSSTAWPISPSTWATSPGVARSSSCWRPSSSTASAFAWTGLDDAGNRAVLKRLVDGGTAFLGPASVKGRIGLRACFMNLRTTRADVDLIMDELARLGREAAVRLAR